MTFRPSDKQKTAIKDIAKKLGISQQATMSKAVDAFISQYMADACDNNNVLPDVVKGSEAELLLASGTHYNWDVKSNRRINRSLPRYLFVKGAIWQVDRTANWSHKVLKRLFLVPEVLLEERASSHLNDLLKLSVDAIRDALVTITELVEQPWFTSAPWRGKQDGMLREAIDGYSLESIAEVYNPVITEPVLSQPAEPESEVETPKELPKRVKAGQLMELYGIAKDVWDKSVSMWRSLGLDTGDGTWKYIPGTNRWVLQ